MYNNMPTIVVHFVSCHKDRKGTEELVEKEYIEGDEGEKPIGKEYIKGDEGKPKGKEYIEGDVGGRGGNQ